MFKCAICYTHEQKVVLGGLSASTLTNYGRCIAKISLHFKSIPIYLDEEQINGYLQSLLTGKQPSKSYFNPIYALRFVYRLYDMEDRIIKLPTLKRQSTLPVVLSIQECKKLFSSGRTLKHRVMMCLIYSAGLRSKELRNLKRSDIDYDRERIHLRQTKYNKDRYVPLSRIIAKGLRKYEQAYMPKEYLFNGKESGTPLSSRAVQWAIRQSLKISGISKEVTAHSLRHSYATHLLEMGMDIDTLRQLLGHALSTTTMVYLHVARLGGSEQYSPLDRLYS